MTRCSEGPHSEKPTNFYNLMSQDMSGQELPRLYDAARVHVGGGGKKKTNKKKT